MKVVGVVGHEDSGRTGLVASLAGELKRRGYKVATIRQCDRKALGPEDKDIKRHRESAAQVAVVGDSESAIFLEGRRGLEEILRFLDVDFVLVEGFEGEKTYPKIAYLKDEKEAKALFDGLQICAVGDVSEVGVPVLKEMNMIADLAIEKAFKLPALDCGKCGLGTCYGLAKEIVRGNKSEKDCPPLHPKTIVKIDGREVPLVPFTSQFIRNTIKGMLSSLKGVGRGTIEIRIEDSD